MAKNISSSFLELKFIKLKILRLIATVLTLVTFASTSQAKNIFDDIEEAEKNLPQKYTLIYLFTSYCEPSKEEFDKLANSLVKNRDNLNFIVLTDSVSYKNLSDKIKSVKPDAFVFYDKYFKSRMHSMKDAKAIGGQFVERYDYEYVNTLFASGIYYIEFPNHNLMKLFWNGNVPRVDKYLSSIPNFK